MKGLKFEDHIFHQYAVNDGLIVKVGFWNDGETVKPPQPGKYQRLLTTKQGAHKVEVHTWTGKRWETAKGSYSAKGLLWRTYSPFAVDEKDKDDNC